VYVVIDPTSNAVTGRTPEIAVQNYIDEVNEFAVEQLDVYQLTNLKVKTLSSFFITGGREEAGA